MKWAKPDVSEAKSGFAVGKAQDPRFRMEPWKFPGYGRFRYTCIHCIHAYAPSQWIGSEFWFSFGSKVPCLWIWKGTEKHVDPLVIEYQDGLGSGLHGITVSEHLQRQDIAVFLLSLTINIGKMPYIYIWYKQYSYKHFSFLMIACINTQLGVHWNVSLGLIGWYKLTFSFLFPATFREKTFIVGQNIFGMHSPRCVYCGVYCIYTHTIESIIGWYNFTYSIYVYYIILYTKKL